MARIRTIKPEFFSDGKIIECSSNARLLFVGTWVFADDFGNLDRSAKQLKAQVFPADSLDCEPLIQELLALGLLVEYSSNGKEYLHIERFTYHQRIDRPGKPRCPIYDKSTNDRRVFDDHSRLKGREGKYIVGQAQRRGSAGTPQRCLRNAIPAGSVYDVSD